MRTVNMHEAKTHLPYLVKAADGEFINARAVPSRWQCLLSLKKLSWSVACPPRRHEIVAASGGRTDVVLWT